MDIKLKASHDDIVALIWFIKNTKLQKYPPTMALLLGSIHKRLLLYFQKKELASQHLKKEGTITLKMDEAVYLMILLHDGVRPVLYNLQWVQLSILLGMVDQKIKSHPDFIQQKA